MRIAPPDGSYLTFTEVVAGYRLLCAINHAVSLGVIEAVGTGGSEAQDVVAKTGMKPAEGERFLELLNNLGITERFGARYYLSQFSRKYLTRESELSQLHVLEFERLLMGKWDGLDAVLREGQGARSEDIGEADYRARLGLFHGAMREAALVRSRELWEALSFLPDRGTVIDVGAGDGTYLQAFFARFPGWSGVACDLKDVLDLGADFYRGGPAVSFPCNILDPDESARLVERHLRRGTLLLFSNILHCYSLSENERIVAALSETVAEDGLVVVHDFFTDANTIGALYDGHMLANTYSGRTYTLDETKELLARSGFVYSREFFLPSASCAVVACRKPLEWVPLGTMSLLEREARQVGFTEAKAVDVSAIRIEPWVQAKCRFGCSMFGKKWSCPPHSMDADGFRELLGCYREALLVVGQPPLRDFQERLLELEKRAFLQGLKKALVFSGGPCTWCESCPEDRCPFPEKRRPSLESCGCDVFDLAGSCGLEVRPVRSKDDFVQYVGLLLVR